ncbi:hypothetical protein CYMTET_43809 [Cymbomonas tetramitiformis]|uniref:Glutamate decarboxylase n=1 Tax=Cymbomonas tetramitiformis TaxID=36881 RepID=A0AAE0C1E1_9CHLO|nr:hypothetical protein CYMTET_43809 [Cymbomonas tetramitiformis]
MGVVPSTLAARSVDHDSGDRYATATSDPLETEKLLRDTADTLVKYLTSSNDVSAPVVKLSSPDSMASEFAAVGVPLELRDGEGPASGPELLTALETTLDLCVRTSHPFFLNQLYAGADRAGVAADWAVVAANTNVHTYEVAPVFTMVEQKVLQKLARVIGGRFQAASDGLFVPGGSIANTYAMHLARHRADSKANTRGMMGGPQLVAFTSEHAHYSYKKAAMLMGLGSDNLVAVACDAAGAMKPDALRSAMQKARVSGKIPFFVGATAGTTVTGAFDPFEALANEAEAEHAWLHVDGAWGGAALLSPTARIELMGGSARADSVAWNAHKLMGMPLQCSAFITAHLGALKECNATRAACLFQPDKLYGEYDMGDKTIQCGRRADAFKLWLAWKAVGDAGWAKRVDHAIKLAAHFESRIAGSEGAFRLAMPRNYANVCFWYVPPALHGSGDPAAYSAEDWEVLHAAAPALKAVMQKEGLAMIGFQPLMGLPNFFRIVFPSCFGTSIADIDLLLERIQVIGDAHYAN